MVCDAVAEMPTFEGVMREEAPGAAVEIAAQTSNDDGNETQSPQCCCVQVSMLAL